MKYIVVFLGINEDVGWLVKVRCKIKICGNDLLNIYLVDCSRGGFNIVDFGVSKVFSKLEKKYIVIRKEFLVFFIFIKYFRFFFYGYKFLVIIDYSLVKLLF